jgi:hypothetical protein
MNRQLCAILVAVAAALPARAEDPPPLELAPLVPSKAPWLKKNQKKEEPAPGTQAKKKKRKKGKPPQLDEQAGAPSVATPPPELPPLALPGVEPAPPSQPAPSIVQPPPSAAPPAVAQPPPSAAPPGVAELPLPPLIQVPAAPPIKEQPPSLPIAEPKPRPAVTQTVPQQAIAQAPPLPASQRRWTRPVGLAALGVGVAVAAAGGYFGLKSHSDLNQAESNFRANGGAYRAADLQTLSSGNTAAHRANALFAASAVLAAAGAVLTLAF